MARTVFSKTGAQNKYAFYDTGMAVSNMVLQAEALDVYVHQMGCFSVAGISDYFRLDQSIEPVSVMAVGYLGDGSSLPPEILKKDEKRRSRKSVIEYSFRNSLTLPAF